MERLAMCKVREILQPRRNLLRKATVLEMMPSVLALVAMSIVLMTLTVRRFRRVSLA